MTDTPKSLTALGSVERFHASEFSGTMIPSPCGDWVRHSDYDVLSAALDAAEARAEAAEAELKEAVDTAKQAIDVIASVQDYKQPDDPWEENALTMCEHEVFDFDVESARAFLASIGDKP